MGVRLFFCLVVVFLVTISSSADDCDRNRCVPESKVAYYPKTSPALIPGACGYGSLAVEFDGGHLAAAVPSIYKDGGGCGACYQIRCKNPSLCNKKGTRVVVTTDLINNKNNNNETDFVVSRKAFTAMALEGKASQLRKLGLVNMEYKRVPCDYGNKNLSIRVEEFSKKPSYLAMTFLYQGGQTEIFSVEVAPTRSALSWTGMNRRGKEAVWESDRIPSGGLQVSFGVMGGFDANRHIITNALPADWKNGAIYDTAINITEIAQNGCSPGCDDPTWN